MNSVARVFRDKIPALQAVEKRLDGTGFDVDRRRSDLLQSVDFVLIDQAGIHGIDRDVSREVNKVIDCDAIDLVGLGAEVCPHVLQVFVGAGREEP